MGRKKSRLLEGGEEREEGRLGWGARNDAGHGGGKGSGDGARMVMCWPGGKGRRGDQGKGGGGGPKRGGGGARAGAPRSPRPPSLPPAQ